MTRGMPPGHMFYRGAIISPVTGCLAGSRWETYAGGRFYRADTLAAVRGYIREVSR